MALRVCSVGVIRWNVMEPFRTWHPSWCSVRQKSGMELFLETEYLAQMRNRVVPPSWCNVLVPPILIALWPKTMKPPTPNLFPCPTSHSLIPSLIHPSLVAHGPIGAAGGRRPAAASKRAGDAAGRDRSRATGIGPERRESVHSDGDRSMVTGIGRLLMGKHWRQLQGRREQRGSGRKIRRKLILDWKSFFSCNIAI
jgi:hypothetical protein